MGRQRVELRREEILRSTITEIERSGMSSLRVADVADDLGVSSGLIFYHFDTRDGLLVSALEFAVEQDLTRLDKAVASGSSAIERLRRVLAAYGPTGAASGWTLWIDAWATALREPNIRHALRRLDDRWRQSLEYVISEGVLARDFTCADPAATVARIGALLDGLSVAALVYRSVSRDQLSRWVRDTTAAELRIDSAVLA